MWRKDVKHALYHAPDETPDLTRCVQFSIPDSDDWQRLLEASLSTLMTWINYHRSGTTRESAVAQIWREIFASIHYGDCNTFEGVYVMPIGAVIPFAGTTIPSGWLECNNAQYLAADYPELYAVIDSAFYRTVSGQPGFAVPDLRSRSVIGINSSVAGGGRTHKAMATPGGAETHGLSIAEMPVHSHQQRRWAGGGSDSKEPAPSTLVTAAGATNSTLPTTGSTGGGDHHNNMSPYLPLRYIIKYASDTIVGTPGTNGTLTMLRQNPVNPYILDQSFNGGLDWSEAFNYSILRRGGTHIVNDIDVINQINNTNNYITEINTEYNDIVTNIYNDAVYGDADDSLRDSTLCYILGQIAEVLKETFVNATRDHTEPPSIAELVASGAEAIGSGIATILGVGSVASTTGNPIFTIIAAIYLTEEFREQWGQFQTNWTEYREGSQEMEDVDYSADVCCIYDILSGNTITETGFKSAFEDCLVPNPANNIFLELFRAAFRAVGISDAMFAVWLDLLQMAFTAQQAGIVFDDCLCDEIPLLTFLLNTNPDPSPTENTGFSTEIGETYRIKISGTFENSGINPHTRSDAFYASTGGSGNTWSSYVVAEPIIINGVDADLEDYNPLHIYEIFHIGDGNPITFRKTQGEGDGTSTSGLNISIYLM